MYSNQFNQYNSLMQTEVSELTPEQLYKLAEPDIISVTRGNTHSSSTFQLFSLLFLYCLSTKDVMYQCISIVTIERKSQNIDLKRCIVIVTITMGQSTLVFCVLRLIMWLLNFTELLHSLIFLLKVFQYPSHKQPCFGPFLPLST